MKFKKHFLSLFLIFGMCLFLGVNAQAKDMREVPLQKSEDQTVTNISYQTFFQKLNNPKEENLIKNIISSSNSDKVMIVKINNKEEYIIMMSNTLSGDTTFENSSFYINYDFTQYQAKRKMFVSNLYQNYKTLNSNEKFNLYANLSALIKDTEIEKGIQNAYLACADYMGKNSYSLSEDGISKLNKKYLSNGVNLTNINNVMGYNLEMINGRMRTIVFFSQNYN